MYSGFAICVTIEVYLTCEFQFESTLWIELFWIIKIFEPNIIFVLDRICVVIFPTTNTILKWQIN